MERSAGILMHITSLQGQYGIGDLGPEARSFADFLKKSGQQYWQILPLNPIEKSKAYSPYSSYSSIAGNTWLISPEDLAAKGWIDRKILKQFRLPSTDRIDFEEVASNKARLLQIAHATFSRSASRKEVQKFELFCANEKDWLDRFALFLVLKKINNGKRWYSWTDAQKRSQHGELKKIAEEFTREIQEIKWSQYLFFSQWKDLKTYCNERGIRLFGDLPFYISYDSVDVWTYPEFFSLDENGNPLFVAGVPPDYFNSNGQLWGMPVFNWNNLKKQRYSWWVKRLTKNMQLYDLLRLDHFRAFADYWAVPAKDKTAKNGSWMPGPGKGLFEIIKKRLGSLPFVAEDLGDINEPVFELRDNFYFPGMKVLHFAFSGDMHKSDYIPHNYTPNFLVYTGTHDNNTSRGWYRKDLTEKEKNNLRIYFDQKVTENNVHTLLIRLAYASVAKLAIIPIQDVLALDEKSRINSPATIQNNWVWRLKPGLLKRETALWLREQTRLFNRQAEQIQK